MSLAYVGPVAIGPYDHGNPTFSWASDPTAHGVREASIGGLVTWKQAGQLEEMLNNPARAITLGEHEGVLEYVFFAGGRFASRSGWYLLQPFTFTPAKKDTLSDYTAPVTLGGWHMGHNRQVIVSATSRPLANDFGLVGEAVLVDPFWNEDASGARDGMLVDVGGRPILREYDETTPMVWP